ncbi:hypothetical protein SDC9_168860 [bioreactor metagenome]|uniref:Uncharacterized protein n=1 Tax=bioreactor metagenome TaxID=1076179 RepID=A0A645G6A9_9ZZZZ
MASFCSIDRDGVGSGDGEGVRFEVSSGIAAPGFSGILVELDSRLLVHPTEKIMMNISRKEIHAA